MSANRVVIYANSMEEVSPISGGTYVRQLRLGLSMDAEQIRTAIVDLLSGIPEQDAYSLLLSEFPEWFEVAA